MRGGHGHDEKQRKGFEENPSSIFQVMSVRVHRQLESHTRVTIIVASTDVTPAKRQSVACRGTPIHVDDAPSVAASFAASSILARSSSKMKCFLLFPGPSTVIVSGEASILSL